MKCYYTYIICIHISIMVYYCIVYAVVYLHMPVCIC